MGFLPLLGLATVTLLAAFAAVWAVSMRLRNAGFVDVAWSYGFAVLALLYGSLGAGAPERRLLISTMTLLWSVRLGSYLGRRVWRAHPEEDGRYQELRRRWAPRPERAFLVFFLAQALLDVALGLPLLLACLNPRPGIAALEWAGVALWAVALAGESVADRQLAAFKAAPANRGRICDVGLWRYSRHPNYFFEWLVWCAYFLFALASPWGWISVYCPALMLYFLFKVTGIPATEEQAVRSKGDAYREYQRTTSAFVPLPRRG